jgi:hypothetical protein
VQSKFKVGDLVKPPEYGVVERVCAGAPPAYLGIVLSQHSWEDSEDPDDRYCMVLIAGKQYDVWEHDLEKVQ